MNIVLLIGRLVRDPKEITGGVTFTLAVDRPQAQDGTKSADFPSIVVFGKQADNCKTYLGKGRLVAVQGRIQTGSYQNKDGETVYTEDVVAQRVKFLDRGERAEQPQTQPAPEPQQQVLDPRGFEYVDEDIPY